VCRASPAVCRCASRAYQNMHSSMTFGEVRIKELVLPQLGLAKPLPATLFGIASEIGIGTDFSSTSKRTGVMASHAPVASPTPFSTPIAISVPMFLLV
jgi:hypothetical protein